VGEGNTEPKVTSEEGYEEEALSLYTYKCAFVPTAVDGDTIDAVIDLGFGISVRQRLRLNGIDAHEMNASDDAIRELAVKARDFCTDWMCMAGESIVITTYKGDKYGRMLADVRSDGKSLNDALVERGLASRYTGGRRVKE
jgi:micrococcal nuclease